MEGIRIKSLGVLIDELVTTDIKCFLAQEKIAQTQDLEEASRNALAAQRLNKRRNELMRAIDEAMGSGESSPTEKTY